MAGLDSTKGTFVDLFRLASAQACSPVGIGCRITLQFGIYLALALRTKIIVKTNFSNSLDGLTRINGRSSGDMAAAGVAVGELEDFVKGQYNQINAFTELREVVTCPDEQNIRSALASMRQVTAGLQMLASFHGGGILAHTFEVPFLRSNEMLKKAETEAAAVLAYLPR